MDLGLRDKVAWVTGASSGMGRAAAEALAREGAQVIVSARRAEVLDDVARSIAETSEGRCVAIPLDVGDADAIDEAARRVLEELGGVDIALFNSGGPPPGSFEATSADDLYDGIAVTVAGALRFTKAVVPSMKERGGGCLVYITSSSSKEMIEGLMLSNMLRPAVTGMAKTLSKELGPHNIRTINIAPGRIETPRLVELHESRAAKAGTSVEEARAAGVAAIPLGRFGRPEEVGDVIAFLASERASYVTGITVVVDGGLLKGIAS